MYLSTLRPVFTESIFNSLQNGESLNVYGSVDVDKYSCKGIGIGKSRLLKDIKVVVKNNFEDITVVSINMNDYRYGDRFDKFLKDISAPLNIPTYKNFANFIDGTDEKKVFLLIDNFHYFFDNENLDSRFDSNFIDNLNSASNKSNISILVITHKPHTNYKLYIEDTKEYRASWLTFENTCITELTHDKLKSEAKRRFPEFKDSELVAIVNMINGVLCIATLDELQKQRKTNKVYSFDKLLEKVKKDVKKNCKNRFDKKYKYFKFLDYILNKLNININIGNNT